MAFPRLEIDLDTSTACLLYSNLRVVASGSRVLDVVPCLELLETLSTGIVDVLSIGDELGRRRRSVGSRHVEWRTG